MKNAIIKNGIIGGLIVSFVMTCMTLYMEANPDNEPNIIVGISSMVLAYIFVILGIKHRRETNDGKITFREAFVTGLSISLVISTIYVGVWLIIYYNFFPNFMDQYSDIVLSNTNAVELATKTEQMNQMKEWYKNPIMVILLTYLEILPIGIIISLIGGLIFKKK